MYMTIRDMYNELGRILRDYKEVDPNALVVDSWVVEEGDDGRRPPGTVMLRCKTSNTIDKLKNPYLSDSSYGLAIMPERTSKCLM